jgi:alkanesulfonate monooxygenase
MPIQFIGMIRTDNASEIDAANAQTVEQSIDPGFVSRFARAHAESGFDRNLIGHHSTAPDTWAVSAHAAASTERLHMLAAHRPGRAPRPVTRSRPARSRERP